MSYLDNKRIRQEFDTSLGTPAIQLGWGSLTKTGSLPCRVTALFNRVSTVRLAVGKEEKTIDELPRGEWKDLEFDAVPEGTAFEPSFTDPVGHQDYKRKGIIRYGQLDL